MGMSEDDMCFCLVFSDGKGDGCLHARSPVTLVDDPPLRI
jgi:hypothetical protein